MGTECRQNEPTPGDCWQGDALNELVPTLERAGWIVIAGTLDHSGLSVRGPLGQRTRLDLVSPRVVRAWSEDDDEAPSDQHPVIEADGFARPRPDAGNGWGDRPHAVAGCGFGAGVVDDD